MTPDRNNRYSRRALLKALGLGMGILPLLDSERVVADTAGVAKRFISITWTNGIVPDDFYPAAGPLTAPLPPILSPLERWKSKVLAMRGPGSGIATGGIDLQVMVDAGMIYSGHFAYPALLTGSFTRYGFVATTPSIDTLIGDALKSQGLANARLNLGCRPGNSCTSWSADGVKNLHLTDPYAVYSQLFVGPGAPDALLARRKSVLDYCIDDLNRFEARLGREDKQKIDVHLTSLRAIENQLAASSCQRPDISPTGLDFSQIASYPLQVKLMIDLIAAAVKCDLARAFTLDLIDDGGGNSLTFPWLGIASPNYNAIAHQGASDYAQKTMIDTWFYSQVASLVAQLAASPEGGSTSLDNSVILVNNDLNEGASEMVTNIPYLIIGSAGGFFKQGTCVQFAQNVPNNQLLTSVCHAMGLAVPSVGTTYGGDLDAQLQA